MIKKILFLILFFGLFLCGCGKKQSVAPDDMKIIKDRGKIIIGVREDTAPFGYRDKNGNLAGFDIELSKLIAEQILGDRNKVEFKVVTASNRIEALNTKEVDILVATMTQTAARANVVNFSTSYFVAGTAAMVRTKSKYTSLNEFDDKPMAVVFGTTAENALRELFPLAKITAYTSYAQAVDAVKKGSVEALIADDSVLIGITKQDKDLRLLKHRYSREPYSVVVRQGSESKHLLQEINELINNLYSTGKIKQLALQFSLI